MATKTFIILVLSLLACLPPPSSPLISPTFYTGHPQYLSSVYIKTVKGDITPCCSAALVSQFRALTSCFCVNLCLQSVRSRQGKFYGGTVYYGLGMTSLESKQLARQVENRTVYTQMLDYPAIKCPGTDMTDTKYFRNDLAVIEIGTVDVALLNFIPVPLAVDDEPTLDDEPDCYIETWSSSKDCTSTGKLRRNYAHTYIDDCSSTDLNLPTCVADTVGCMRFNASVLLTKGDVGADIAYSPDFENFIQFGVASWQRKTEPLGYGCTTRKQAQVYTKLSAFADWLMMTAPNATYKAIKGFTSQT